MNRSLTVFKTGINFNRLAQCHRHSNRFSTSARLLYNTSNKNPLNSLRPLKPELAVETDDAPLPYLGSEAADWTAKKSRIGCKDEDKETPWYQPLVLSLSIGLFLIYFCILREENDIDAKLSVSLFDHYPELEVHELRRMHAYNLLNGLPVEAIEERLKEMGTPIESFK